MKTIAFIIPYFGKLPDYFKLWLYSCGQNPTVDFYVFTDDNTDYVTPKNVSITAMTFEQAKELFQEQFDFPISLHHPYKLCDYKPVYGKAFRKWVQDYDFWGHCDIDLIWGNIRNFFTDDILSKYERVLWQGHCSIYLNNSVVNNYYHTLDSKGCIYWQDVYTNEVNFSFDEYAEHNGGGLSLIMEKNNISMYKEWIFADLCVGLNRFQCAYTENSFYTTDFDCFGSYFERNNDGLFLHFRKNGEFREKEFLYCHFQKRKVDIPTSFAYDKSFVLLPPGSVKALKTSNDKCVKQRFYVNAIKNMLSSMFSGLEIKRPLVLLLKKLRMK